LLACYQTFLGHDLPGQLVALQGLAGLLQAERLPPETSDLLGRIVSITRRLDALVRRVADLGRIDREPPFGPAVPLAELVQEAAAEVRCTGGSGLTLECTVSGTVSVVKLSRRLCHGVLVQLLRNSAQAALTTRPLHVEVQAEKYPPAFPEWALAVTVADNGRGIAADQAARLFVPLAPGSGAVPRDNTGDGAGLGLFLVRQVVAHWSGAIQVRSEPGQGTAITLLLPPAALPGNDGTHR
jgi:signal transduction histidine kinase